MCFCIKNWRLSDSEVVRSTYFIPLFSLAPPLAAPCVFHLHPLLGCCPCKCKVAPSKWNRCCPIEEVHESCESLLRQPIKLTPGEAWREEEELELAAIDALCSALCANKQGLIRTAMVTTHHNQTAAATNSQKQKNLLQQLDEKLFVQQILFLPHNCYKFPPNSSTKFRKSTFYSLQIIIIFF